MTSTASLATFTTPPAVAAGITPSVPGGTAERGPANGFARALNAAREARPAGDVPGAETRAAQADESAADESPGAEAAAPESPAARGAARGLRHRGAGAVGRSATEAMPEVPDRNAAALVASGRNEERAVEQGEGRGRRLGVDGGPDAPSAPGAAADPLPAGWPGPAAVAPGASGPVVAGRPGDHPASDAAGAVPGAAARAADPGATSRQEAGGPGMLATLAHQRAAVSAETSAFGDASATPSDRAIGALVAAAAADAPRDAAAGGPLAAGSPLAGLSAAATASAPAGAAAAVPNPPEARLTATPGQPGFAPQLGAQLTLFVRDGVQLARLQLHPAELGPVLVQIQLDGQAAQVHLSAENPFTRDKLGEALPVLAGSLREAGLTLAGGGVFEQPRRDDPAESQGAAAQRRERDDARAAEAARVGEHGVGATAPRRRGVVDLVA